jgi:hypothetical protein
MTKAEVYIKLLDEGVDVWRPVVAEYLGGDRYRLISGPPEGEVWPFAHGDIVRCEKRHLAGEGTDIEAVLVAREPST